LKAPLLKQFILKGSFTANHPTENFLRPLLFYRFLSFSSELRFGEGCGAGAGLGFDERSAAR
jgi:hypothetical protein